MASKHTANNETQVKSWILSNAEKEIISSTTDAWSNVMLTCNKQKSETKMEGQYTQHGCPSCRPHGDITIITTRNMTRCKSNVLPPAPLKVMWMNNSRRETTIATVTCHKALIHMSCILKWSYIECRKCHLFVLYCHSASDLSVRCFCCHEATGVSQFVMKLLVCHSS